MAISRTKDFVWIVVAYLMALLAGGLVAFVLQNHTPWLADMGLLSEAYPDWLTGAYGSWWIALIADVAATLVIFGFSRAFDNASFYDAYWSVAPPILILYWWGYFFSGVSERGFGEGLLGLLVALWAVRLTHNWARGWQGLRHVDWRYVDLKAKTGIGYVLVELLGIQLMPTLLVIVGCLPVWLLARQGSMDMQLLDLGWIMVGYAALWIEWRADLVLHRFRAANPPPGSVLKTDVWSWCRHPNYLGELGFWLALAMAGYLHTNDPLAWLGFACMALLFIVISIPMIDKRQLQNKPNYAQYKAEVPSLLPLKRKWMSYALGRS